MTSRAGPIVGRVLVAAGVLALTAGCGPVPVGTLAVSQRDGHLLIAVLRCDDTALRGAEIRHGGPLRTDVPRKRIDDARWTTDLHDEDVIILDAADPGAEWETVRALGDLDPQVSYTASAGGDADHPMGVVAFTTGELDALGEGEWLTEDAQPLAGGGRPTTADLDALRSEFCDH
ncbi:hypothetical protein [Aeromicrobium chenweiae]|uniref:Uncharacterized protein n=1 Tax=Aeromicrobium chenweiae TaxID=2079793 RepID=A0A2S0WN60_9ACTN|nr:hypothetical protein [Aeromicrobium chenweiae]AWB92710.1 hypothetical protein C3E78_11130 [Aeromicrobium chenweiae]TGN33700.1 hypothetical protein E4L97_01175 [Aeromicrobium chenweiae]